MMKKLQLYQVRLKQTQLNKFKLRQRYVIGFRECHKTKFYI
jgi:hypothetical protein